MTRSGEWWDSESKKEQGACWSAVPCRHVLNAILLIVRGDRIDVLANIEVGKKTTKKIDHDNETVHQMTKEREGRVI